MTTHIEGQVHLFRKIHAQDEVIRGRDADNPHPNEPEYFDTMRSETLYHNESDAPAIRLDFHNTVDHAVCVLREVKGRLPKDLPPVRVAVDGHLQDLTAKEVTYAWKRWEIHEGKKWQAWLGGETFEQRDMRYGFLTVTWAQPGRKPR